MKNLCFLIALVFFFFVSCASTPENLQRETARYLGNINPEKVKISDIDRGVTSVKWKADTPKGMYDCSADDNVRRVYCVKE